MHYRSDPADHDAGWAATAVKLTTRAGETLSLPCHWIEYSHAGKGKSASAFFVVSTDGAAALGDHDWRVLAFTDGGGKSHRYAVSEARVVSPLKIRLTKVT